MNSNLSVCLQAEAGAATAVKHAILRVSGMMSRVMQPVCRASLRLRVPLRGIGAVAALRRGDLRALVSASAPATAGPVMTVDFTTLVASLTELSKLAVPAKVQTVTQTDAHTVVLTLRPRRALWSCVGACARAAARSSRS